MKQTKQKRQHFQWSFVIAITVSAIVALAIIAAPFGTRAEQSQRHASASIIAAALSADGNNAIVIDKQHIAYRWQRGTDNDNHALKGANQLKNAHSVELSADGQYALIAADKQLTRWSLQKNQEAGQWQAPTTITDISFADDGQDALVGLTDGSVHFVNLAKGKSIQTFKHSTTIKSIELSQDKQYALTGCADGQVNLWDIKNGKLLQSFNHKKAINKVAISNNNQYVLSHSNQDGTRLWNLKTGKLIHQLALPPMVVTSAKFSPNNQLLALGSKPQVLLLINIESNKSLKKWVLPKENFWQPTEITIHAINFHPNQPLLQTEDSTGHWRAWRY